MLCRNINFFYYYLFINIIFICIKFSKPWNRKCITKPIHFSISFNSCSLLWIFQLVKEAWNPAIKLFYLKGKNIVCPSLDWDKNQDLYCHTNYALAYICQVCHPPPPPLFIYLFFYIYIDKLEDLASLLPVLFGASKYCQIALNFLTGAESSILLRAWT